MNQELCPQCSSPEWDHIIEERGMHPCDLPINRCCHCQHEWMPEEDGSHD